MPRVNFDEPTYLRVSHGLALVSERLDHLLPEPVPMARERETQQYNPVVINRTYNPKQAVEPRSLVPVISEEKKEVFEDDDDASFPEMVEQEEVIESEVTELSIRGNQGKPVEGVYMGSGFAPYRFNKGNSKSFYLRIDSHLLWGVELNSAIRESGAVKGDTIAVTFLGKAPIKVLQKVNVDGKPTEVWETRHRNRWEIKVLPD